MTYRLKDPKATLKIFSTGSITVTGKAIDHLLEIVLTIYIFLDKNLLLFLPAPCVTNIQAAIEHIYPLVNEFRKERTAEDIRSMQATKRARQGIKRKCLDDVPDILDEDEIECIDVDDEEEDAESDQSLDWK